MTGDKAAIIAQNWTRCICTTCPTYNECMRADDQRLFCVTGKAPSCTFDKKGCLCPACPVTQTLGLRRSYFCIRGSEPEQV